MDQVNDSNYLIIETTTELNQLKSSQYSIAEAINIYIINGGVYGASARTTVFDDDIFVDPWSQCHEMGHYFGLLHPDGATY